MASKRTRSFVLSAQQVDPLSWFTGPLVPLAFAGLTFLYGTVMTVLTWGQTERPWLQFVAVLISTSSGLIIHFASRPMRSQFTWQLGVFAMTPAFAGMVLSAIGYAGSAFSLELWWAPGAVSLSIASLGPYLPVRTVLLLGSSTIVASVVSAIGILHPTAAGWGPVAGGVIIAYPPSLGLAATAVFSYSVVNTMLRMLESPSRIMVAGQQVRDEAAEHMERVTIAHLTARAAPFLEDRASGRITPADRALAGQLARRLRDDLVTQSNLSWLDSVASDSRLVVVDPDRRAHRMNNAQRTALRAMLAGILETPGIDSGSLMVDLRAAPDGATAVALSLDMALPEGRRIMHLAPYYLTLKTAVDDLKVDRDALLKLSFRIPDV